MLLLRPSLAPIVAAAWLVACSGSPSSQSLTAAGNAVPGSPAVRSNGTSTPITHVVIVVQENRSFDNLFARFPGADGATKGRMSGGRLVKLRMENLAEPCDLGHSRQGYMRDYDGGKMNGFDEETKGKCGPGDAGRLPYQYVNPQQIAPYWFIAQQYVLSDQMFATQGSGSFTAHQDLIRGGTTIDEAKTLSIIDSPSSLPWGCDASAGTKTSLVFWKGKALAYEGNKGPFPCSNAFPPSAGYPTLRDLLDAKSISWKYYTPALTKYGSGGYWNAFDVIAPVRFGPEWGTKVVWPETKIFGDISGGTLPSVSWVIPREGNSDHPATGGNDKGPSWVASIINAIGTTSYWNTTAIIVVWDDWGGFYDHVKPAGFDHWGGLGFRVPMLVISPYGREAVPSKPGYISHTQYEFGSILKFVEDNWSLGRLGTTDKRATSISDCFDFTQSPRTFIQIPSSDSREYFLKQPEDDRPVDTE
ncbi:MAG: hypothetical protein JO351_08160 [Candidatus Eremiobacteraeota bacterium]|nr:hypothetical protein [Candidatus Eremiobacteraeota bacterium]